MAVGGATVSRRCHCPCAWLDCREEFVSWYSGVICTDIHIDDLARQMFATFDIHNHGEITLGDFKQRIDVVSMDMLTLDEIGAIVQLSSNFF